MTEKGRGFPLPSPQLRGAKAAGHPVENPLNSYGYDSFYDGLE
jgi:hypothetical protein